MAFRGVPALHGIDLVVGRGESVGLVGESGCGKSVTWLAALGLLPGSASVSGSVRLEGEELLGAGAGVLDRVRGGRIATIFQDPASSLNPVHRVGRQVAEAVRLHRGMAGGEAEAEARRLLDQVGIPDAGRRMASYPHEMSGGQNQRVMIAMALAGRPELLVADEPTTALDVTIQAGILDLLRRLQAETGMAMVLISHDLGVVAETCSRVCVMYAGRIVEEAGVGGIVCAAVASLCGGVVGGVAGDDGGRGGGWRRFRGGCRSRGGCRRGVRLRPRCSEAIGACDAGVPGLRAVGGRLVACIRAEAAVMRAPAFA